MIRQIISRTRSTRYRIDRWLYRHRCNKEPLRALRNRYKNRPLLVVGNGPSLNDTPLDDFREIPSIGMNKIDLLFDRVAWRPTLIICANTLVVKQHAAAFRRSEIPVFISWRSRWFLGRRGGSGRISYYLNTPMYEFSTNLLEGVGVGGTVTFEALQFAYYMGANPVILFGIDHNFRTDDKPAHYVKRSGPDTNHFDPNYFKAGTYWGVPDLVRSEQAYRAAREAFEADRRTVYDATIGGKLEIFEKINLADAKRLVAQAS